MLEVFVRLLLVITTLLVTTTTLLFWLCQAYFQHQNLLFNEAYILYYWKSLFYTNVRQGYYCLEIKKEIVVPFHEKKN